MKKTIIVPVDFTSVSHNALQYACELSKLDKSEIIAAHLLESNMPAEIMALKDINIATRMILERMTNAIIKKINDDLDNFILDLKLIYGDVIQTSLTHGNIFHTFNDIAAKYSSSLIVMGTHGIHGLQHLIGSRAYKVVVNTPIPFLIIQNEEHYRSIDMIYFAFKNNEQFRNYVPMIHTLSGYFPGKYFINILESNENSVPKELEPIANRITIINKGLYAENIIECAVLENANAICICIDEFENIDGSVYGTTQEKILDNKYKLPVLCLPKT